MVIQTGTLTVTHTDMHTLTFRGYRRDGDEDRFAEFTGVDERQHLTADTGLVLSVHAQAIQGVIQALLPGKLRERTGQSVNTENHHYTIHA